VTWAAKYEHHSIDGGTGWDRASANVLIIQRETYIDVVVDWVSTLGVRYGGRYQ
jgi:hypothetical protein